MEEEEKKKADAPAGAPMWIVTFSDMMSLLLCFFVLLLTMSETKPKKFKMASGSLRDAFGVQRTIVEPEMPKAESVIKEEFSPGPQQPVPPTTVTQQFNIDTPSLEEAKEQAKGDAEKLKSALKDELQSENVEIITQGTDIVVRIKDKALFSSGSAALQRDFIPSLAKITTEIKKLNKFVVVAGHTDDIPITSKLYRSNWDLSSARAVTLTHAIMKIGNMDSRQFTIMGHADTRPIVPNTSSENRAKNRRVEIVLKNDRP